MLHVQISWLLAINTMNLIIIIIIFYAWFGYHNAKEYCYRKYIACPDNIWGYVNHEAYYKNLPKYKIVGSIIGAVIGFLLYIAINRLTLTI